ncbi:hypothetical protein DICVIV_06795 [Dictyocaulus viviparus]|uniref:Uncharacterized protein n=1 Tax=Dictyocaulus viviparus TaxID=29172 RepID=A0A0D8XTP3_DICVI|nr:hypothetical protein DICVIV_06795 [Dictyocaulus viviparus]
MNGNVPNGLIPRRSSVVTVAMVRLLYDTYNEYAEWLRRFRDYLYVERDDVDYYLLYDEYLQIIDYYRNRIRDIHEIILLQLN